MLWIHTPIPAVAVAELGKRVGVGPVIAELLLREGHADPAEALDFLKADLSSLADPFLVGNVLPAVRRLKAAMTGEAHFGLSDQGSPAT